MALLHYLKKRAAEYSIVLSALNCDHGIRGVNSERDSDFVKRYCEENGVPLLCFKRERGCGKDELSARLWRMQCYMQAMRNVDAVATAHHMNDNAETVLFNLARGTYLEGMRGITDFSGGGLKIVRPMIECTRAQIDEYIRLNGVPFTEDETNSDSVYTRNKIRNSVLPALERAVPGTLKSIFRFSRLAADDEEYFSRIIENQGIVRFTAYGAEVAHCGEKAVFRRAVLKAVKLFGSVKDYTSEQTEKLYELQFAANGKKFVFLRFTAFKESGKIAICENNSLVADKKRVAYSEYKLDGSFDFSGEYFALSDDENLARIISEAQKILRPEEIKILKFDGERIPKEAEIRFPAEGDRFLKFGGGTKKLGDYFTDLKIPHRIRLRIPVIADGGAVLAAGGIEISDLIKITPHTRSVLYLICKNYGAI